MTGIRITKYRCGHTGIQLVKRLLEIGSRESKKICKECREKNGNKKNGGKRKWQMKI